MQLFCILFHYALHYYNTALYVHICTTLGLTHACSHANRVSGVDSTSLCEAHPGVLSDSLTELAWYLAQRKSAWYTLMRFRLIKNGNAHAYDVYTV